MRDVGLWATSALMLGLMVGVSVERERADMRLADANADRAGYDLRACAATCSADATRSARVASEALADVQGRLDRLRDETARAWTDCAVPGVWHDLGVVTLPEARGER